MATSKTIYVRAGRADIMRVLSQLSTTACTRGPIADAMMTRCGLAALGRIKEAFVVKARGWMDAAGDKWPPLSPATIAYRRRAGRTNAEKKRAAIPSQALNKKQQERWWHLYRQGLAMFKRDKAHAAARAWFILKQEGVMTLLDKYGNMQVEILRDTGILLNSLSPGVSSQQQIFQIGPGYVIVGTNREGAAAHHSGAPKRNLPQRRLWPDPKKWPPNWWLDIQEQCIDGLLDIAVHLVGGL